MDDHAQIEQGIMLADGISKLQLKIIQKDRHKWQVSMHEGRNRQIRRTFGALGYRVIKLHRTHFGDYSLQELTVGNHCKK